ncbi:hypothetical protein C6P40_002396 [Pichia californica]|uniref:RING-type domain-containing protein n=1 Tax=Pichia californica TaxID=460514 RepID=A0A9P6WHP8_9ASCO|nr:hypothetical protein C6P42_002368 [[Candida] californica]KAG0687399.1 hypothetical protein C6P40_002396 [[Candida] californica]
MTSILYGNPKNRVLQLDGYLLDEQIVSILQEQVTDAFSDSSLSLKIQRIGSRHSKDILFALKLLLFKLFVWDKSTTYGLLLQNLKLSNGKQNNLNSNLNKLGKLLILINLISSYTLQKISSYLYSDEIGRLETTNPKIYAVLKKIINYLPFLENLSSFSQIINKIAFYLFGDYTSLYNRFFGIRHHVLNQVGTSFASNPQAISYEFQDRQLIWNSFTEFINNISDIKMPRFVTRSWKRAMKKVIQRRQKINDTIDNKEDDNDNDDTLFRFLPERCCAICYSSDININKTTDDNLITNPYITNCGHIYCYFCIMNVMGSNNGFDDNDDDDDELIWNCLRCNGKVQWCKIYTDGMKDIEVHTKQYFESDKYLELINSELDEDEISSSEGEEDPESDISSQSNNSDSDSDSDSGSDSGSDSDSAYEYDEDGNQ